MITKGQIVKETKTGFYMFVPCINHRKEMRAAKEVYIEVPDPRRISQKQRKKIYVLLSYISMWWAYSPVDTVKEVMKLMFRGQAVYDEMFDRDFSLSNCSMTTARLFITYLIDFCLLHNVDLGVPLYELCEDVPRYVWACLMNKRCAVCGQDPDLHHVDAIGMGRNRNRVLQIGIPVLPLCRKHHKESHDIGQKTFLKKYFLQPIPLTEEIGRLYPLTNINLGV